MFCFIQTSQVYEFGESWAVNADDCENNPIEKENPCESDALLLEGIETSCSLFDSLRNGGNAAGLSPFTVIRVVALTSCCPPTWRQISQTDLDIQGSYALLARTG